LFVSDILDDPASVLFNSEEVVYHYSFQERVLVFPLLNKPKLDNKLKLDNKPCKTTDLYLIYPTFRSLLRVLHCISLQLLLYLLPPNQSVFKAHHSKESGSMKIYYAVTASPCLLHGSPSSQLYLVEHIQSLSNSLHSSILKIDSRHYSSYIFFVCSFKTSDLFSILPCHLFHFFICSQIAYLNSLLVVCLSPQQSVLNAQPPHYSHKCFYLHVLMTTLVSYLCTH